LPNEAQVAAEAFFRGACIPARIYAHALRDLKPPRHRHLKAKPEQVAFRADLEAFLTIVPAQEGATHQAQ
jgi:hypothetical protein